jgi:hypothetical protein
LQIKEVILATAQRLINDGMKIEKRKKDLLAECFKRKCPLSIFPINNFRE